MGIKVRARRGRGTAEAFAFRSIASCVAFLPSNGTAETINPFSHICAGTGERPRRDSHWTAPRGIYIDICIGGQ
jgi:hypothetical protein